MYLSKKIGNESIRKDSAFWQGDDGINAGQSWQVTTGLFGS